MGVFKVDDIRGYWFENEVVCGDCTDTDEINSAKIDQVVTEDDIGKGDYLYFCDRCKERIL
jgi:hypothetical protein